MLVHLLSLASTVTCQCSLLLIFGLTDELADSPEYLAKDFFLQEKFAHYSNESEMQHVFSSSVVLSNVSRHVQLESMYCR